MVELVEVAEGVLEPSDHLGTHLPPGARQVGYPWPKMNICNMFMNDFWKENDLDGSQGDLKALGNPQRPRQAQPWGEQQVPFIFIKNWHGARLYTIFKDKSNQNCPKLIMVLSDTLRNLEYRKYQLCSSEIDMTNGHILFFKDKSI